MAVAFREVPLGLSGWWPIGLPHQTAPRHRLRVEWFQNRWFQACGIGSVAQVRLLRHRRRSFLGVISHGLALPLQRQALSQVPELRAHPRLLQVLDFQGISTTPGGAGERSAGVHQCRLARNQLDRGTDRDRHLR
jgi:hypothetical protein